MVVLVFVALTSACTGSSPDSTPTPTSASPVVHVSPEPTTGPYVVVAVNYHFHDIHPEDHKMIGQARPFIVKNETENPHNFSVVGTPISVNIPPGEEMVWDPLGAHLKPGFYQVFCKFHADRGMTGAFTVVP